MHQTGPGHALDNKNWGCCPDFGVTSPTVLGGICRGNEGNFGGYCTRSTMMLSVALEEHSTPQEKSIVRILSCVKGRSER